MDRSGCRRSGFVFCQISFKRFTKNYQRFFPKVSVPVSVLIYRTYYTNKKKEQMFEKLLHICYLKTIIKARNFERVFLQSGGNIMENEKYKRLIIDLINKIEDEKTLLFILEIVLRLKD